MSSVTTSHQFNESGYALATVLIILSLLMVVVGVIMVLSLTQSRFIQRDIHDGKARYFAEAGLYTFLSDSTYYADTTNTSFDVILPDSVRVTIHRQPYGAYWLLTSMASSSNQEKTLRALVGAEADSLYDRAIVMGDVFSGLIVTGTTTVRGDIVSGSDGLQRRSFRGDPFSGTVDGANIRADSSWFPQFDSRDIAWQLRLTTQLIDSPPENATILRGGSFDARSYSQPDSATTYVSAEDLTVSSLQAMQLTDHTTFIVDGALTIEGALDLGEYSRFFIRDSIVINGDITGRHSLFITNGSIQVRGNSHLSTQLISRESITVSEGSYLTYPSVVYLQPRVDSGAKQGFINLNGSSRIDGIVILPDVTQTITNDESLLTIEENAFVRGGVYNTSRTELLGTVQGTVLTHQFYFYQSPTNYINWLRNADIDLEQRPAPFTIPLGFSQRPAFTLLDYNEVADE